MSKHNGYMIGKQRLSQLTRPRLMALAVKLDGDVSAAEQRAGEEIGRLNNLLQAAVEAGENLRQRLHRTQDEVAMLSEREVERSTTIDNLETDLSKARATVLALEVARARLKRFCVNITFAFTIGAFMAGATVAWLGAWAAFQ